MEGLLAVSPNVNGPFDTCAKCVVEAAAKQELQNFKTDNEPYMAYI